MAVRMSGCVIIFSELDGGMRRRKKGGEGVCVCVCGVATDRKKARRLILQFSYITAPPPSLLRPPTPPTPPPDLSANETGDSGGFTQIDLEESKTHREKRERAGDLLLLQQHKHKTPAAPPSTVRSGGPCSCTESEKSDK